MGRKDIFAVLWEQHKIARRTIHRKGTKISFIKKGRERGGGRMGGKWEKCEALRWGISYHGIVRRKKGFPPL